MFSVIQTRILNINLSLRYFLPVHHVACSFLFLVLKNLTQLFKTVKAVDFYYYVSLTTTIVESKLDLDVINLTN